MVCASQCISIDAHCANWMESQTLPVAIVRGKLLQKRSWLSLSIQIWTRTNGCPFSSLTDVSRLVSCVLSYCFSHIVFFLILCIIFTNPFLDWSFGANRHWEWRQILCCLLQHWGNGWFPCYLLWMDQNCWRWALALRFWSESKGIFQKILVVKL